LGRKMIDLFILTTTALLVGGYIGFNVGRNTMPRKPEPIPELKEKLTDSMGNPLLIRVELFGEPEADSGTYSYKKLKSLDHFGVAKMIRAVAVCLENEGVEEINSKKRHLRLVK
jgi:hypothetical protein